jgi:two-component system CheB/CheR fusion protein
VGIGASAGGLAAYEAFFSAMPEDTESGMAFVLVQHLSPDHKSILTELVRRYTRMQVHEVVDGMEVQPNSAYIIPPNADMAMENTRLRLYEPNTPRGQRLPIDFFFRSLAREHHERAICVVLSGTGSDGTLGVRAVKGEGGMAMAQAPDTTEHEGMPRSAIATGMIDFVLAPGDMPAQLILYAKHAFGRLRAPGGAQPSEDGVLKSLTSILRNHTGHDFSQYKSTTLIRRMQRRMALHQIENPEDYFRYARQTPPEVELLFRDLLIGVTSFFRDPEAFKALEENVIPRLFDAKSSHDTIRVWVCGCSTGEEAYSIAILLQEHLERLKRPQKIQIFATDIDSQAIDQARAGVFPPSIAADVSPERLSRHFISESGDSRYRVRKVIRDMLVFSEQDVIRDPPFSKLDLISCRNLLIYLKSDLQRKLIPRFHYALNPGGFLFLGTSETVGDSRLFLPLDRKWKLYATQPAPVDVPRLPVEELVPRSLESRGTRLTRQAPEGRPSGPDLARLTESALVAHYVESAVLINDRGDILHIIGRTGKYLEPASGDPVLNILAMAREGLRRPLTMALHTAVSRKTPVHHQNIRVATNGHELLVDLTVRPAGESRGSDGDPHAFLVVLKEAVSPATPPADTASGPGDGARMMELEQELRAKEEYLQTTLEEMETTNEELKSTNEEMQSVNEELQSTNEELETSKEELQSVNEELSTVNAELQDKVADLSRTNNDMNNLLAGTGIGTLFVDHDLRISRFTPATTQVMHLIGGDVGRPVDHVVSNLVNYSNIADDIRAVLDSLHPREMEVRTKSGAWFLLRIRPYRTLDNVIEGVVLTFVDISERKRMQEALAASEARFQAIFNGVQAGLAQADPSGHFTFVNDYLCTMLGFSREDLLRLNDQDLTHPEDLPMQQELLDRLLDGGESYHIEKRYRRKNGSYLTVGCRVSRIRDPDGAATSTLTLSFAPGDHPLHLS